MVRLHTYLKDSETQLAEESLALHRIFRDRVRAAVPYPIGALNPAAKAEVRAAREVGKAAPPLVFSLIEAELPSAKVEAGSLERFLIAIKVRDGMGKCG